MGYISFAVVIFVACFTLPGTKLNEASADPVLARWSSNVAVDLGLKIREDPPITTDPPTFTEHADVICTEMHGKNSVGGVEAGCIKDPKCPAYAVLGTKGMRCKGEVKIGDGSDDDTTGMKGLEAKEGKKVFIKDTCSDGIKNQDEEDIDCGGAACPACALKNSCGDQPSCDGNGAAPDCDDATPVCKCGTNDGCMVASADTAPLCVEGTCKCDTEVDACTGGEICIGKKCVAAACGDAPAACPENEECDSDVCKCPDSNGVKGPSCAGNPGGEFCDTTAAAPTCKCTADVDSCSGNLLKPNCDATAGQCDCAPGDGGCAADSGTLCVDKKCMCGTIEACTDAKAPTCDFANSQCMCGTGPGCADMTNADTCDKDNNKCKCGENDPCGKDSDTPICKEGACVAAE